MTVVAFTSGVLACDSQISSGTTAWASVRKIRRVKNWLIGAAGDLDSMTAFLKSFNPDTIHEPDKLCANSALEALMISPEGVVNYREGSGIITKIKHDGFIAIGSGGVEAMCAMAAGATAVEAVKIAIRFNKGCGGKIYKLELR
jgi:ATP-dependent protease HslVU (ClpYQ) peptidase subunit